MCRMANAPQGAHAQLCCRRIAVILRRSLITHGLGVSKDITLTLLLTMSLTALHVKLGVIWRGVYQSDVAKHVLPDSTRTRQQVHIVSIVQLECIRTKRAKVGASCVPVAQYQRRPKAAEDVQIVRRAGIWMDLNQGRAGGYLDGFEQLLG